MNNHEEHIKAWYASLCSKWRQFQLNEDETQCANCEKPKKSHYHGKCTSFVTSREFRAVNAEEVCKTGETLAQLESLMKVSGWKIP